MLISLKFCYKIFKLLNEELSLKELINSLENYKIDKSYLFNFIFYPIIDRYDIYSMGIVLAEIVLFSHDFDKCNKDFQNKFKELIKDLLFNKFDDVSVIIIEIDNLQKLI